jgi:ABC-type Fe3+/spermidine/putrescine transport system ATPase subunit
MPEVKIVNVSKRYGKIVANDQVNFTIENGEYVSVIGPSGCGKTTLIKNIAGIIKPDEGDIYIDGKRVNDYPIEDRGIGYVFQNIALFPHLSVWDNITYGPNVRGVPPDETRPLALEMLEMIKIGARSEAYPFELSGGAQQKTAVARALVSKAELLLLDEPLGALDVKVRTELRHELRRLVKDLKLTAFHVTHDQEEAMSISDRVIVMKKGRIIEAGAPLELYTNPKNIFTANFVGEANFLVGDIIEVSAKKSIIHVGGDLKLISLHTDHKIGDRVVVAFRPEFVAIKKEKTNQLSGKILEIMYSGSVIRVKIQLSNMNQITFKKVIDRDDPPFRVEEQIRVTISPKNILTYSYPTEGLEEELSLE